MKPSSGSSTQGTAQALTTTVSQQVLNVVLELPSCLEKCWDEEHFVGPGMCCWSCEPSGMLVPSAPQQLLFPGCWAPPALKGQLEPVRDDVIALNCYSQADFLKLEFREDLAPTPWLCHPARSLSHLAPCLSPHISTASHRQVCWLNHGNK